MSKITFNSAQSSFFKTLKEKVDNHFSSHRMDTAGNRILYFKSAVQLISAVSIYIILVFYTPGNFLAILLCGLFGFNMAIIGFNIMHEGGHQSFSKHPWLNKISAYSLNALGGNAHYWKIKHNVNHHTYTNIEGMDSDIDVKPFMRLHEDQPHYWFHRFQHWYWFILYGISYMAWVFYEDFEKYFTRRIAANSEPMKFSAKEHLVFWTTKLMYVGIYLVIPIIMVGWVKAFIGYIIISFVCGLVTSVVFQLAHMVEDTQFPKPNPLSNKVQQEWAVHQVETTANFATKNKVISWFLGGLNFQIEHHLFPRISHIHYPRLSVFVKETCKEYNIQYTEYSSLIKAFYSHLMHIRKLGMG
ncbi:MAG TPA: acyl-CoA desaturase [Chryseolinea sp.]|nr:acyl-CoA desaturase [Chryseolinea sp.]